MTAATILLLALAGGASAQNTNIGPLALMLAQHQAHAPTLNSLQNLGLIRYRKGSPSPSALMLVRFKGGLDDITSLGAQVSNVIGDVASVALPIDRIDALARLTSVTYAELALPTQPDLDLAAPESGASALRGGTPPSWSGSTGSNVIIGIVDSGIDLRHPDFRDPLGRTRVLHLFDETTGVECTQAQIDAGSCGEIDTLGHGTHVAGIAAGNGSATGNGQPAYRFVGMAPEAKLIVAKMDWSTTAIVDAVEDIKEKAAAFGMPVVINLSMGNEIGPHDGTDNMSRALNAASGPGRIVVISAGNYSQTATHAGGTITEGATAVTDITIPVDTTFTLIDIWYAGADQYAVKASNDADCEGGLVPAPVTLPYAQGGFCDNRLFIESENINALNGDREILIELNTDGSNPFGSSTWHISLQGTVVAQGRFDAWTNGGTSGARFLTNISTNDTIGSFAAATSPISVAAYNTKGAWNSLAGPITSAATIPGQLADFSSRGPRRPCSALDDCPAVQKPEIAAPGAWVASSYSAQTQWPAGSCSACYLDPDGVHRLMQGTSMSAPMVAGAVALLLQIDPTAIPDDIRSLLEGSASADDLTGPVPNAAWGYGELNVKTAFDALQTQTLPAPQNVMVTADGSSAMLSWSPVSASGLAGYNVYRSTISGSSYTRVASVSSGDNRYTDSGLVAGTYYYVLRAVDTNQVESLASSEISATIGAADGGGGGACDLGTILLSELILFRFAPAGPGFPADAVHKQNLKEKEP